MTALVAVRASRGGRLELRRKTALAREVLIAYFRARRALRKTTLPEALAAARTRASATDLPDLRPFVTARHLASVVQRVLRFFPDARCLTRSLVLVNLLARREIHTTLVIGVAPAPKFRAHAWVELDGTPLLPTFQSEYQRLTEL